MANSAGPAADRGPVSAARKEGDSLDDLCKRIPGNSAYCDVPEHEEDAKDMTSLMLRFASPEYAQRFAKAFRHAVELLRRQGVSPLTQHRKQQVIHLKRKAAQLGLQIIEVAAAA